MLRKFTIIFVLIFSLLLAGCPNKENLERAEKESGKIAAATDKIVNAIDELFTNDKISAQTAKASLDKLGVLIKYGKASDEFFTILKTKYGDLASVPKSEFPNALAKFLDVVNAFVGVLADLKIIPQINQKIRDALDVIVLTIKIIAKAFNRESEINQKLAAVQ